MYGLSALPAHCSVKKKCTQKQVNESFVLKARIALWKPEFPLDPHDPDLGTWIMITQDGVLGCKACTLASTGTNYAEVCVVGRSALRKAKLRSHDQSHTHVLAVATLTQCQLCIGEAQRMSDAASAPPFADFKEVCRLRRQGGPLRGIRGIGDRRKVACMQKCVAEGVREIQRNHCWQSSVFVLNSDARSPRYTVRFAAGTGAQEGYIVRRGVLSHVNYVAMKKQFLDTSTTLAKATIACVRRFCTTLVGTKKATFMPDLFKHITQHTEFVNADAEQTNQLANEDLTNALGDICDRELPNAGFHGKDFTHGMRRLAAAASGQR